MAPQKPSRPSRLELISTGTQKLRKRVRAAELWRRALETPALWVVLFLLLGTWALVPGAFLFAPRVTANSIADRDYVATRDLLLRDEEATQGKEEQAREAVLPVYDFDPGAAAELEEQVAQLFGRGRRLLAAAGEDDEGARQAVVRELMARPSAPEGLRLTQEQLELLTSRRFSPELQDRLARVFSQALRRGVVGNKTMLLENRLRGIVLRNLGTGSEQVQLDLFGPLGYPEEARGLFEAEVGDWNGYSAEERRILVDLLLANLPANLLPNRSETLARRDAAGAGAGVVFNQVRKGQVIVRKGDVIDEGDAFAIAQMRGERQLNLQVPPLAGTLLLLSLVAAVVWLGLQREKVADHGPRRLFGEGLLLLLLSILGAKFCFVVAAGLSSVFEGPPLNAARSWAFATPFATLALLTTLLLGRNATLLLSILFSVLSSRLVVADNDPAWVVFYAFAGSLAAIYALERYQFRQRLVMARVGALVGLINVAMALIFAAFSNPVEKGLMQTGFDVLCAFASGLLAAAVASFAIPILEAMLGITTDIKLLELSNTNLPLLRRLAFEAPGTFQHSLMVANLAKEGCEAIGSDPILAYAGGLYHDVGKVFRPDYFIENQRPGQNRHDKLQPSMSALILLNHVKDGVELAREHGLPRVIRDAIQQHHGTRLIKYFYNRAKEQRDPDMGEVTEEKYRYPGPRPQNKVMGVLMLADAVEAASRTLTEPTPQKIRGLIRTIVDDCLNDGQLDQTDLTLSDLSQVSEAFLRVLANIFHQRVDYPGFDFNAGPKRDKRPVADAVRAS